MVRMLSSPVGHGVDAERSASLVLHFPEFVWTRRIRSINCCVVWFACGLLVGAQPSAGQARSRATYRNPVRLDMRIPEQHPYLALTAADIERAKERIRRLVWAKQVYDRCLNDADADLERPWDKLPNKDDPEHWHVARRLFSSSVAYALSGDKKYARWSRDGLLAYADLYPRLPLTNGRCKVYQSESLYEAMWVVQITQAYDLVADSGVFTEEEKRHVENDLLRAALICFRIDDFQNDPRIKDLHYRCYNFQAWHLAAVGLIGLAVRDLESIEYAVNSPYGFRHLVAHDIRDDGLFWERSVGYHNFVLEALLPFAEGMAHCGVDLFHMTVPNDRSWETGAHYVTDSSDKPKSLRMMFEAPFYLAFPDLSYPALGDSDLGPLRPTWEQLAGFHHYRDSKLSWLVEQDMPDDAGGASLATTDRKRPLADWHWLVYSLPDAPGARSSALPLEEGEFANSGEYRNGCSLFPSSGLVVLREASGDFTQHSDSTAVSLSYGPHGGGHGHPDKMNLVVYSQGRQWIPAFASMPYETHWKAEWTAQTISHNTVVVDGVSQQPTGVRNVQWPTDEANDQVIGRLERFAPEEKLASASCDRAYPGMTLKRTVRLVRHDVVDDYSIVPESSSSERKQHQFDYVLHIDGELKYSSLPLAQRSGKLGEICGYQYVEQKQAGAARSPLSLTFASGTKQLRLWIIPTDGAPTELIVGEGLTNSPDVKMAMLILRREAARARFVTVIEPFEPHDSIRAARIEESTSGSADFLLLERSSGVQRVSLGELQR